MAEGGYRTRDQVVYVLKMCLGESSVKTEEGKITIYHASNPRVHILPPEVPRSMIQELANRYEIAVHLFYQPEMLQQASKRKQ